MVNSLPETAAVQWQCRRGMLELDMMLAPFFDAQYEGLTLDEKRAFVELLQEPDQVLYQWLIGREEPITSELKEILDKIRRFQWKG